MLLWAGRFGKQEAFMSALNTRHFTRGSSGESASHRPTLLAAAAEVGLDADAAAVKRETAAPSVSISALPTALSLSIIPHE